jgi:topoisomerase-4 subunit A
MPIDLGGQLGGQIDELALGTALSERYLAYALSTIMSRSLPDVRDGLKPVHRRLIYAMHQLKLDPRSGFKKCARVVGDVMGKFHPHGDSSIYEALVRLAQEFSSRFPLIEGQGNFGNIDGDNAAAMRYTESRLTEVAEFLLRGIDENAVDFRATYDGEESEPVVLPGAFPNLLANGATGICRRGLCRRTASHRPPQRHHRRADGVYAWAGFPDWRRTGGGCGHDLRRL